MYHPKYLNHHQYHQPCCLPNPSSSSSSSASASAGTTAKTSLHGHVSNDCACRSSYGESNQHISRPYFPLASSAGKCNYKNKEDSSSSNTKDKDKITCHPSVLRHRIDGMEGKKWTNLSSWTNGRVDVIDFGGKRRDKKKSSSSNGSRRRGRSTNSSSFIQESFCTSSSYQVYSAARGGGVCCTQVNDCSTNASGTDTIDDGGKHSYNYTYNHNDTSTHYTSYCSTPREQKPQTLHKSKRCCKTSRPTSQRVPDSDDEADSEDSAGDEELDQLARAIRESKFYTPGPAGDPSHLSTVTGSSYSFFPPSSSSSLSSLPNYKSYSISGELLPEDLWPADTLPRQPSSPAVSITPSSSASRVRPTPRSRRRSRTATLIDDMKKWSAFEDDKSFLGRGNASPGRDDQPPRYSDLSFRSRLDDVELASQVSPRISAHGRDRDVAQSRERPSSPCCSLDDGERFGFEKWLVARGRHSQCSEKSRSRSVSRKSQRRASDSGQHGVMKFLVKDWA